MPSKHTPGPWTGEDVTLEIVQLIISAEEVHAIQVSPADQQGRAIAYIPTDANEAEQRANGRVILATPDLLKALKQLVAAEKRIAKNSYGVGPDGRRRGKFLHREWARMDPDGFRRWELGHDAIAKAEGE